ncbi:ABC transporter permease [Phaeacidiphilus oryzae]|uniref:ABC transporter permease n=1 Tax=Phaeacidiphilus oryzae TaxID=348818 RepID=UPI00056BDA03|nr:ABC transporter permease [Phaeacidiphilus oryzae]
MSMPAQAIPDPSAQSTVAPTAEVAAELIGRTPRQIAWARFKRNRTGIVCACIVIFYFLIAAFAPLISKLYGKDPYTTYGLNEPGLLNPEGLPIKPNGGISGEFWLGVEPGLGRDVFTLLIYGIRTTLVVSLSVAVLVIAFGVGIGLAQGYLGGWFDYIVGRITDLMLAFPSQLFMIAFTPVFAAALVKPGQTEPTWVRVIVLILVQFVLGWMAVSRLIRSLALSLRERDFIDAARLSGASPRRIIRRELLPNVWSTVLVQFTLWLPTFVGVEAGLSYLGVGIVLPTPDWGLLFQDAAPYYQTDLTYMMVPGISLTVFVLAFNLLGDAVRDALDPRTIR